MISESFAVASSLSRSMVLESGSENSPSSDSFAGFAASLRSFVVTFEKY